MTLLDQQAMRFYSTSKSESKSESELTLSTQNNLKSGIKITFLLRFCAFSPVLMLGYVLKMSFIFWKISAWCPYKLCLWKECIFAYLCMLKPFTNLNWEVIFLFTLFWRPSTLLSPPSLPGTFIHPEMSPSELHHGGLGDEMMSPASLGQITSSQGSITSPSMGSITSPRGQRKRSIASVKSDVSFDDDVKSFISAKMERFAAVVVVVVDEIFTFFFWSKERKGHC